MGIVNDLISCSDMISLKINAGGKSYKLHKHQLYLESDKANVTHANQLITILVWKLNPYLTPHNFTFIVATYFDSSLLVWLEIIKVLLTPCLSTFKIATNVP